MPRQMGAPVFNDDMIEQIKLYAKQRRCSLSDAVRLLCEVGAETLNIEQQRRYRHDDRISEIDKQILKMYYDDKKGTVTICRELKLKMAYVRSVLHDAHGLRSQSEAAVTRWHGNLRTGTAK